MKRLKFSKNDYSEIKRGRKTKLTKVIKLNGFCQAGSDWEHENKHEFLVTRPTQRLIKEYCSYHTGDFVNILSEYNSKDLLKAEIVNVSVENLKGVWVWEIMFKAVE